MQKLVTHV